AKSLIHPLFPHPLPASYLGPPTLLYPPLGSSPDKIYLTVEKEGNAKLDINQVY
ncbi:hypothetical protein L9F63_011241, partial [Diploptera punctata]